MAAARQRSLQRLPPEVNRALYVRNLPFKITSEEMYDIFGKFGAIRQIRLGNAQDLGDRAVVYEDIYDARVRWITCRASTSRAATWWCSTSSRPRCKSV